MLLAETRHHGCAGRVKHDDVELGEHLLCVQQALVGEGGFRRRRLQGRLTPPAEYFSDHHGRERDLGPWHPQRIQAYGDMPLAKSPEDVCVLQIHTR
jgi:hypothetical protein